MCKSFSSSKDPTVNLPKAVINASFDGWNSNTSLNLKEIASAKEVVINILLVNMCRVAVLLLAAANF